MSTINAQPERQHTAQMLPSPRREAAADGASVTRLVDPAARPSRRRDDRVRVASRPAGTPAGDRQLLRAAALGDAGAWDALVDEYAGHVWITCVQCGLREDEAAAVSTLVWVGLLDALPNLDVPLSTWLLATTTREAHKARLRARAGRPGSGRGVDRRRLPRSGP